MAERNRLARDIHDTLAQGFTGVIVQLEAAADAKSQKLAEEADDHLRRAASLARESLQAARRSVRALRPQALEHRTLRDALQEMISAMTDRTGVRAAFTVKGGPRPLPADWEENLLHIGQEVVTNALRHARATAFSTEISFGSHELRLAFADDGCGFALERKREGLGLLGIRERVEGMGGVLTIESAAGKGTRVAIALPAS